VSSGSTRMAARPATSGSAERLDVTTGVPAAMASSTGMPKPSSREGKAKIIARAYHEARIAEETYPVTRIRGLRAARARKGSEPKPAEPARTSLQVESKASKASIRRALFLRV